MGSFASDMRAMFGPLLGKNGEGLTWNAWYNAATAWLTFKAVPMGINLQMRKAWRDGEDPTEWAHYFSTLKRDMHSFPPGAILEPRA